MQAEWVLIILEAFALGMPLPFGLSLGIVGLLEKHPTFHSFFRKNPWIKNYAVSLTMFLIALSEILWLSRGQLEEYGLGLGKADLVWMGLSLATAIGFVLIVYIPQVMKRTRYFSLLKIDFPLSSTNVLGMMSHGWLFNGVAEEFAERGVMQTFLMKNLDGFVRVLEWDFHVGTIITVILIGIAALLMMIAPEEKPKHALLHSLYAMMFHFFIGYIYQQTNSLIGPVLAHNVAGGSAVTTELYLSKQTKNKSC